MSYYRSSFSQSSPMGRGRGYSSPRGSYRGSSSRGGSSRGSSSWGGGRGSYSGGSSRGKFSSFGSSSYDRSYDSRNKYSSERFSSSSRGHSDDYHKSSYRPDSYSSRDSHRSPERKRPRTEAPSSRHESSSFGGHSSYSESRRSYSGERHTTSTPYSSSRREEFRRPSGLPPSSRGSYRGRISSRAPRGSRLRDRPPSRSLIGSSYIVRKRALTSRSLDYGRRPLKTRMRSAVIRRGGFRRRIPRDESSGDEKEEVEEEEEEDEEVKESKKSKTEDGDEKMDVTNEDEGGKSKAASKVKKEKDTSKAEASEEKSGAKNFIKLECPHCHIKVPTFKRYEVHLLSRSHMLAMRKVALKQRSILGQMRQAQRNTQNELEKKSSNEDLTSKTSFCPLCKLNYKQRKLVHQETEAHKNMRKFLMPYCKVCNVTFKSPMIYENHCCSIEHIKRKQRVENESDGSGEDDNLEDFTTIDSVGDAEEGAVSDQEKKEKVKKEPVNVGIEQVRKLEAHYCDLCRMYLPRGNEDEMPSILAKHCKLRVHMQRYVRFKENQALEKKAQKLQRKEMAEKEKKKEEAVKDADETKDMKAEIKEEEVKDDSLNKSTTNEDDKLWADVDKDLGEILAEADGAKSSDEDEDDSHVNGERYDRFKLSEEKNEKEEKKVEELKDKEEKKSSEVDDSKET